MSKQSILRSPLNSLLLETQYGLFDDGRNHVDESLADLDMAGWKRQNVPVALIVPCS